MTCFDGFRLKKSRSACSILGQNMNISFWAARRAVMVHSVTSIALLLASFDIAPPSDREKPSWIDWTIEISPFARWVLLGWFPARRSRFRVSHRAIYCARRSLTSYRPVMHMCSHFGERCHRSHMMCETAAAGPSSFWQRTSQWVSLRAAGWSF